MKIRLVLVLAIVAALGLIMPAHADETFTGYCNPDPYFCIGVAQASDETFSGTFLVVDSEVAGVFAGTESDSSEQYQAAGACGGTIVTGACVVAFTWGGYSYVWIDSPAGCETIALDGGSDDWC